jgi:glutamate-ammonia-ligase adenylyltransferase
VTKLLDLEFLVQFLILNLGDPSCSRFTHTLDQLHHLFLAGVLSATNYMYLKKAYKKYHYMLHQSVLRSDVISDKSMHEQIMAIYREFFNNSSYAADN